MFDFFKTIFSFLYKLLALLNLQPTLFIALIGAVLYFTGVMNDYPVVLILFQVFLVLSAIYAIIATVRKLLGLDKRVKKSKGMQIVGGAEKENATVQADDHTTATPVQAVAPTNEVIETEKPRYFRVKQNPDYVMAEYADRYELFLITDGGLKKIRTDYK